MLIVHNVLQIALDKLTKTAEENWSTAAKSKENPPAFQPDLVVSIYNEELGGNSEQAPAMKRAVLLEISQYLENYLWPNFDGTTATFEHVMSMILMVNEKFREGVPAWSCFHTRQVRQMTDRLSQMCLGAMHVLMHVTCMLRVECMHRHHGSVGVRWQGMLFSKSQHAST